MALVGLINLVPAVGALSADRIATAYGVAVEGPDLALLLRHRAALFGIVGGLAMVGAIHPPWRGPGAMAAGVSMGSFLVLSLLSPATVRHCDGWWSPTWSDSACSARPC